jgi:hypothetical protein
MTPALPAPLSFRSQAVAPPTTVASASCECPAPLLFVAGS